jgi:hypothetical protein
VPILGALSGTGGDSVLSDFGGTSDYDLAVLGDQRRHEQGLAADVRAVIRPHDICRLSGTGVLNVRAVVCCVMDWGKGGDTGTRAK